jgi:hypothetical protein
MSWELSAIGMNSAGEIFPSVDGSSASSLEAGDPAVRQRNLRLIVHGEATSR